MSELQTRAAEIKAIAANCDTILGLSRALGWSMEITRHANTELSLNLPEHGLRPAGERVAGRAVPKPTKAKSGGAK